jgi:hypothetical protein
VPDNPAELHTGRALTVIALCAASTGSGPQQFAGYRAAGGAFRIAIMCARAPCAVRRPPSRARRPIYVGDTEYDMGQALVAGATPIGIGDGTDPLTR